MPKTNKPDFSAFRRGVGESRDALFGLSENFPRLLELDLAKLKPNPDQPRKSFDEEGLRELASSIERHGLLQPITVQETGDGYMIVSGERRFRAHQLLGRETIFAIVTSGNPRELAIIENVQRQDLNPVDLALGLAELMREHGYTQEELGKVIGKAKSTVSELLSVNDLPEPIKEEVRTSEQPVSKSVLIEVARAGSEPEQLRFWERVKAGQGTVRAARQQKREKAGGERPSPAAQVLAAGQSFIGRLEKTGPNEIKRSPSRVNELIELRDRLTDFVDNLLQGYRASDTPKDLE
jgi:ParB family chromosome partitioning protein